MKKFFYFCSIFIIAVSIGLSLYQDRALACTSIVLKASDGSVVYGRTMEWGTFDLRSRLVIIPRKHKFVGHTPDGKPGIRWRARYGVVALDALEKNFLTDGMNEAGLVVGVLYLPGFTEYQKYDPIKSSRSMGPADLAAYVLTQYATVDEVKLGLKKVSVVPIPEPAIGNIPPPLHLSVVDKSGRTIVVEYINGKLQLFDNPVRVLTNAPNFNWHITNLRNYINLSAVALPSKNLEKLELGPLGAGSGLLGLPGDYTPPSRFVRAVVYTQTARKTPTGPETIYEAFRILDNFNLPLGSAEGPNSTPSQLKGMRSSTIWVSAADTRNLVYYYHTQHNRKVRRVDLKKIDFSPSSVGIRRITLDSVKAQDYENITP